MSAFFFYPVLQALSDGKIIRKSVAVALKVLGVLTLVGGLLVIIQILKAAFQFQQAEATLGGLLFAAMFLVAVVCVAQVLWYRASSVSELGESAFTVIPIVSIMFRAIGEVYATLAAAVGVGGCLLIWLARTNPLWTLGALGGLLPTGQFGNSGSNFVFGISFLFSTCIAAFCGLIIFYFLAESIVVMVDVAKHVRLLVKQGEAGARLVTAVSRCPNCSAELDPGSRFCCACGAKIAG
jgi:hypothetical protein